jgi:succinoglycan biosynthesis transport protein ExoP
MLQTNPLQADRTRLTLRPVQQFQQPNENGIGEIFNTVRGLLRRQYPLLAFAGVLGLAIGLIYLRITPPTYTAQVQLLLGNPKAQFIQQQSLVAEPPFDLAQFDTQLQVLRSRAIAISVIDQLKLNTDRALNGSGSALRPLLQRVRSWLGSKPAEDPVEAVDRPSEEMITAFLDRLSAARVNISNVIEISFSWTDPAKAAEIANAIANAYIADQLNAKFEANKTATVWLEQRLQTLKDQAEDAERAVNTYRSQNNMVASTDGKPIDEQGIADLNSRLIAARAQSAEAGIRFNRYQTILSDYSPDSDSIGTLDAAGSDILTSPIINSLRQQYLELSRRESEYAARFGKDHLTVISLRNRMRDLRSSIFTEVRRLGETARSDLELSKQRQQELEAQLADAVTVSRTNNSAEVTLRELQTKAKGYRNLYDTFLQRYMGSAQQESFPISEARVIYPAFPPQKKSKPKTLIVLALSLFGGIGLGTGLGLLRDLMDRVFRTPNQLEAALGLPCLAVVPRLEFDKSANPQRSHASTDQEARARTLSTASAPHWAVVNMPLSRFAEAIRSIRLGIDLNLTRNPNKVIGITSSLPSEGKSTIAASLAQLIGQSGKSVVIVDCDLRNPSLSKALAPNAKIGLLDVIFGTHSFDDAVWKDPKTNLLFLPVVKHRHVLHSSEILTTEQMRKLFEKLRSGYDYVIVDLPPMTPIVDVRASSDLVDCFVFVVEWGRTKIDVVKHALHTAPNVFENVVGTVLNKTDFKGMASYDAYRSDYYSESHYTHYGLNDGQET